jgi:hypothetical protein
MPVGNTDTTIFKKAGVPLGASTSNVPGDTAENRVAKDYNSRGLSVDNLKSLDQKTFDRLLSKKDEQEIEISRGFAEQAIPPGLYKVNGHTYFVCPQAFFTEDNIIGQMIVDYANTTGATIKTIEAPVENTSVFDKKFILGIWFGMYSSTNQKRRRGKQSYELGRTCSFSLIVKNVFEKTDELGPRALIKDNFFFGNHAEEVSERSKVPFFVKMKLRAFFDNPGWGDLIYGIINYTASFVGFTYLTEEEQDNIISDHLVPVDQLIISCYPVSSLKRGRQVVNKIRKPNPIRVSPLYTKEEMELLARCSSLIFTELADLSKDYESTVFALGFSALEAQIREVIRLRWETLQRFANRTKIRLQTIRKIVNNPTLKKANVVPDQVDQLLIHLRDPVGALYSDVIHILGGTSIKDCLTYAFKKRFSSERDSQLYLYSVIFELYRKVLPDHEIMKTLKIDKMSEEPSEVDFGQSIKYFIQIRSSLGQAKKNILGFAKIQSYKLVGRTKQLKALITKTIDFRDRLNLVNKLTSDVAIKLTSEGKYSDHDEFFKDITGTVQDYVSRLLKISKLRIYEEQSKEVKNLLTRFVEDLKEIDLRIGSQKVIEGTTG